MTDINNINSDNNIDSVNDSVSAVNSENVVRPVVDDNNICVIASENENINGRKIINCVVNSENGNINGEFINPVNGNINKAMYSYSDNVWYFGHDIAKLNLVNLADRTKEERQKLGALGAKKAKENRDAKKNFNELARAMLELTMTDDQITEIIGENAKNILPDQSVASVMLAKMIQGACEGSFKCAEFVRDSAGFKPRNEVELQADVITDADRGLIEKLQKRLTS